MLRNIYIKHHGGQYSVSCLPTGTGRAIKGIYDQIRVINATLGQI